MYSRKLAYYLLQAIKKENFVLVYRRQQKTSLHQVLIQATNWKTWKYKWSIKWKKRAYIQSYHQLAHLDERQREHVQTLQNLGSHYALCQTSQIPARIFKKKKDENKKICIHKKNLLSTNTFFACESLQENNSNSRSFSSKV